MFMCLAYLSDNISDINKFNQTQLNVDKFKLHFFENFPLENYYNLLIHSRLVVEGDA